MNSRGYCRHAENPGTAGYGTDRGVGKEVVIVYSAFRQGVEIRRMCIFVAVTPSYNFV